MATQRFTHAGAGALARWVLAPLLAPPPHRWRRQHSAAPSGRMLMVKVTKQDAYALTDLARFHQLLRVPGVGTRIELAPRCRLFSAASALGASFVRSCRGASPELLFWSRWMGRETAEAEAVLAGSSCEIGILAARSGFADPSCLAAAAGARVCRCQEEPCSGARGCCSFLGQTFFLLLREASQRLRSRASPWGGAAVGLHQGQTDPGGLLQFPRKDT